MMLLAIFLLAQALTPFEEAKQAVLSVRPNAEILEPEVEFILMSTDGINPDTGNPGFRASRVGLSEATVNTFCEQTTPDHHSCNGLITGYTPLPQFNYPLKSYVLEENPPKAHELGPVLFFLCCWRETCEIVVNGFKWQAVRYPFFGHGGACDPLTEKHD